jgi:segregation and condensation protein A
MIQDDWIDVPQRAPVAADVLTVTFDVWEGPLDLLLALARGQRVDLREISILALVEQYLAYIEGAEALKLEVAADYLVMAAWLAYLKSCLLLPRDEQQDPSPEELALRLQLRLQRLNAMRDAAGRLMARDRLGRDVFLRAAPEGLGTIRKTAWDADLFQLMAAYGQVQARSAPAVHVIARRQVMTLEEALARIEALIGGSIIWSELVNFLPPGLSGPARASALASSFVAVLELARQGHVDLLQEETFAPLFVSRSAA